MARASARKLIENEECWVLVGRRRGPIWLARKIGHSTGKPAQVEFDGPAVLGREERRRDIIGFYHTHPGFSAALSRRDIATMQAWVGAFGKPLICLIRGADGLKGYRFDDFRSRGAPLAAAEEFPRGLIVGVDADGGKIPSRRAVSRARAC